MEANNNTDTDLQANNCTIEVLQTPKKKLTKKEEVIKFFCFVGFSISAGIVQVITFSIFFYLFNLVYWPSYLIALFASVVYNFTLNRKFTFKSTNNIPVAKGLILLYYAVFTPLSTWWGDALTNIGWNEVLVLFGTMVINFVTEYLFDRFVVFRKPINTRLNSFNKIQEDEKQ